MRIGHYVLEIYFSQKEELHPLVTKILGITPTSVGDGYWRLYLLEKDDEYINFIGVFLNLLEGKYEDLERIGVERNNIVLFATYEYYGQCNTEFEPEELARLGMNGIALCISCWENPNLSESENDES